MTPLDHELRTALARRAASLGPAPDPLAGIEHRAVRIRRRRTLSAVLGSALAVSAVAIAVPAVTGSTSKGPGYTNVSADPTPTLRSGSPALPANAMPRSDQAIGDPEHPRHPKVVAAWAAKHPGPGPVYTVELTAGSVDVTPPLSFAVLELWRPGGPVSAVVAQDTDSAAPVLTRDQVLPAGASIVDGVISGTGGGPYVVYAAATGVTNVGYDPGNGTISKQPLVQSGRTGAILNRTGPSVGKDALVLTYNDGRTRREDVYTGPTDGAPGTSDGVPSNLLASWPQRGEIVSGRDLAALKSAFAAALGRARSARDAQYRALWAGTTADGVHYTTGQAWVTGDQAAYGVSYASGGSNGPAFFIGPATPAAPSVLAWVIDSLPKTRTDLLVVISRPGIGQVSYDPDGSGRFTPAAATSSGQSGVALFDRPRMAMSDRIEVLNATGNPDKPLYQGPVMPLLCGLSGCG